MKIKVKVKPGAKYNLVEITWEDEYLVSTTAAPEDDRANRKITELLAEYFNKPKSKVILDYGGKSREKYFEILD